MATSPIDIMRCAKLLCDEYGAEADLIAATRADKLLANGELDGHATWKAIVKAIADIKSTSPREGQVVH